MNIKYFIKNPKKIAIPLVTHCCQWMPDSMYLKLLFRAVMNKRLNLNNPITFSEKLQWLKLYDRRPEYTKMVDKYAVKKYVADTIGEEYIIPTLGVWDKPEDIDFDSLPNQFVLKTTHGGGSSGVVICKNKKEFDCKDAVAKLKEAMKIDIYKIMREWPYKNVPKRIIAEKYIEPSRDSNDLPDYKFFCFNGEPKYCQVISGRNDTMSIDFFDHNWQHQLFHEPKEYPFAKKQPLRPKQFERMWDAAKRLSKSKAFSRIDFYEVGDNVFFGEITFFPTGGFGGFDPEEYDLILGQMINLKGETERLV